MASGGLIGKPQRYTSHPTQQYVTGPSQGAYTLPVVPGSADAILVFVGNAIQRAGIDYTVNGTALTMTVTPSNGVIVYVVFLAILSGNLVPTAGMAGTINKVNYVISQNGIIVSDADQTQLLTAISTYIYGTANSGRNYTLPTRGTPTNLGTISGGTVTLDLALSNNYTLISGGNITFANPSNIIAAVGQSGVIRCVQGASWSAAYGSAWRFPSGSRPTFTTGSSSLDFITYYVDTSTTIVAQMLQNMS